MHPPMLPDPRLNIPAVIPPAAARSRLPRLGRSMRLLPKLTGGREQMLCHKLPKFLRVCMWYLREKRPCRRIPRWDQDGPAAQRTDEPGLK